MLDQEQHEEVIEESQNCRPFQEHQLPDNEQHQQGFEEPQSISPLPPTASKTLLQNIKCLPLCVDLRNSSKAVHKCSVCKISLSQICPCKKEDPESDNPMHRVHILKESCFSQSFSCPECGKIAKSTEILKCHMESQHTKYR